jgi:SAM-dependent methyltransferase
MFKAKRRAVGLPSTATEPHPLPMSDAIEQQYATGGTRDRIEQALLRAGKDLGALRASDLAGFEHFHSLGLIGTTGLIALASVTDSDVVLDAGTGIGGTARWLADQRGCQVTAIDLTPEFCETARWLNTLVGLEDRITVKQGDVTDLPFEDAAFDVVISQHVQMNIEDKPRLFAEARRVLRPGGRLAIWDVAAGPVQPLTFPVPWADSPERSYLVTPDELRGLLEVTGFTVSVWNDLTDFATSAMKAAFAGGPQTLGLQLLVPDFAEKGANLVLNGQEKRLRLIQAVLIAR